MNPGLIPRSLVKIFDIVREMSDYCKIKLKCYFVEIYLDQLRDLLLPKGEPVKNLDPKNSATGLTIIPGVTEVDILKMS